MKQKEYLGGQEGPQEYPLDVVVVLGVNIQKDPETNRFILDKDLMGARSRGLAVSQAYLNHLAPTVLVTGGKQKDPKGAETSRAALFAEFIAQRFKVPTEHLIPIGTAGNTMGNVEDTARFLSKHPELLTRRIIGVLTNDFHMPRAIRMFAHNSFFSDNGIVMVPLEAEQLMIQRSGHFSKWVEELKENPLFQEVRQKEQQGLEDLEKGVYRPTHE